MKRLVFTLFLAIAGCGFIDAARGGEAPGAADAGTPGSPDGGSCDCGAPPANGCIDANTLRKYAATGSCTNGKCSFPSESVSCPHGCESGACAPCVARCDGAECGDDGCGGSCGACRDTTGYCSLQLQCVGDSGARCGDSSGLSHESAWPMAGFCGTRAGRSPFGGPDSGTIAWVATLPQDVGPITTGLALGADGTVYVGTSDGRGSSLCAVSPDGEVKWCSAVGDAIHTTPLVAVNGRIHVGSNDSHVYAFEPDGRRAWSFTTHGDVLAQLAVLPDGTVLAGSNDHDVYAIAPDGTQRWKYGAGSTVNGGLTLSPDGHVFVPTLLGPAAILDASGNALKTGNLASELSIPSAGADGTFYGCLAGSPTELVQIRQDLSLGWRYPTNASCLGPPAIGADGTLYLPLMDHSVHAIAPDGTRRWRYPTGTSPGPVLLDNSGRAYFTLHEGTLVSLDARLGTKNFSVGLDGQAALGLALAANGTLYAGAGGSIFAIRTP